MRIKEKFIPSCRAGPLTRVHIFSIYCTRKILKAKCNKHKELTFLSLRNQSVDIYKQALERASFPNYDNFHNPDTAYNDVINRLDCVINAGALFKTARHKRVV